LVDGREGSGCLRKPAHSACRFRWSLAPNHLFTWRRLYTSGALSAVGTSDEAVATSEYRVLQQQVRELQRLPGKKTLESEILREELNRCSQKRLLHALPGVQ
jgi:transposase